jgi:hypothetical protein
MQDNNDSDQLPCEQKAKYVSQKEANGAALLARHKHGTKLKAYLCNYCGLWHLASYYDY